MTTQIELDNAAKHLEETIANKRREAIERGLLSAGLRLQKTIQTKIIPARSPKPVDRGVFKAGWRVYREGSGDSFAVVIENPVQHAAFIEYGVRAANIKPGRRMIAAIAEWVLRKKIVKASQFKAKPKKDTSDRQLRAVDTRGIKFRKGDRAAMTRELKQRAAEDESIRVAWAIAKKMQKRGIFNGGTGFGILKEAMQVYAPKYILEEVTRELKKL